MEKLFILIVNRSLVASWLILAILVLRLFLKKAPKRIPCFLWGLVAVRLVCPLSLESVLSLIPSAEPLPENFAYAAQPQVHNGVPVMDGVVNPMVPATLGTAAATANPSHTQIVTFVFSCLWVTGVVCMFSYAFVTTLLLKRRLRTATLLEKGVKQSEYAKSPFVLGIFKPTIYLPYHLKESNLPYVIAHERAHIERRDTIWKPLAFFLLSIYWFHPLLWVAYALLCRDIEAACDEKVIQDMDIASRRAYSAALLACSIQKNGFAACPVAFGENSVKTRIKEVMNYKKPKFWIVCVSIVACIVVAVCFLTNPERETENEQISSENNMVASDEPEKEKVNIEDYSFPYGDIGDTRIRTMGVAYAPYVLELNAEERAYLSNAILTSKWMYITEDIPRPDGEAYMVYVYDKEFPYQITFYADGHAQIDRNGETTNYWVQGVADLAASKFCAEAPDAGRLILCEPKNLTPGGVWISEWEDTNEMGPYTFEIIGNPVNASVYAKLTYEDANSDASWEYQTEEIYVSELDVVQNIGFCFQGYLFLAGGKVYCIELEGDNAGTAKWVNDAFLGASAAWVLEDQYGLYNLLYLSGYNGPDIMVINTKTGDTIARFDHLDFSDIPDVDAAQFYWPNKIMLENGSLKLHFASNGKVAVVDPNTGKVIELE